MLVHTVMCLNGTAQGALNHTKRQCIKEKEESAEVHDASRCVAFVTLVGTKGEAKHP